MLLTNYCKKKDKLLVLLESLSKSEKENMEKNVQLD